MDIYGEHRIADTACVSRLAAVDSPIEFGPGEPVHIDGLCGIATGSRDCPAGLIAAHLGDEDWERHIICADVTPSNILGEALAPLRVTEAYHSGIW